ncbi:hypothetical protein CUP0801 [Campylobacter upsaliensis RM3195]|nr:hypothetical protein CUP0801 [Campylobacter upsaliensis RM3195]
MLIKILQTLFKLLWIMRCEIKICQKACDVVNAALLVILLFKDHYFSHLNILNIVSFLIKFKSISSILNDRNIFD